MLKQGYDERYDIFHHSRLELFRCPQGAVETGGTVVLRIGLGEALSQRAVCMVNVEFEGGEHIYEMRQCGRSGERVLYDCELELPEQPGLVRYCFVINDTTQLLYYGTPSGGGKGQVYKENPVPYQITVHKPYTAPDWLKRGILYHIFVDRFNRGTRKGAFVPERVKAHTDKGRTMLLHEDWTEPVLYEPLEGCEFYEPCDFYGGDFAGIEEKLDYLQGLGVSILYLSPIFESPSNHKYNTSDYLNADPMFGTNEDFERLCAQAANRGMRVILDGVFSHTGSDSVYFNKDGHYKSVGAYQSKSSPYFNWYTFTKFPEDYEAWWGFKSLPEVNEMHPDYVDFTLKNKDSVIKHWLHAGASGYRLDVADELPDEYIQIMRSELKATQPDAILLGEVWEDASNKFSHGQQRKYVMGSELDSVMNYPFRAAIIDFLLHRAHAHAIRYRLESLQENYPREFYYACMNLISSHDMPRALSLLSGAPDKDSGMSREQQAVYTLSESQLFTGRERMGLAIFLQFVLPGVPSIYYGDEAGMTGLMDPFNRGTYPWGKEDAELLEFTRKMSQLRREHDALGAGGCVFISPEDNVLGAIRCINGGRDVFGEEAHDGVYVALANRSEQTLRVLLDFDMLTGPDAARVGPCMGTYQELISGDTYTCKDIMRITLEPFGGLLLKKMC